MQWQLTLTWTESGRVKTQIVPDVPIGKTSECFRIGRDPAQCDLILLDNTISRRHVEIFFKPDWNRFYLRNLQPKNPPKIDGGILIEGEAALSRGSLIELGQVKLNVTHISDVQPSHFSAESVSAKPDQYSPPISFRSPILFSTSTYSLECPHCRNFSPLDMRNSACTHCGHFLADAESILIPPSR
jgi:FHA domain